MNKILMIAPHPDDEFLSSGYYLSQRPNTFDTIIFVSHGGGSEEMPHIQGDALAEWRESETIKFYRSLGDNSVPWFERLGYPFELTDDHTITINHRLQNLFETRNYDLVIAPHELERHSDHAIIGRIVKNIQTKKLVKDVWYYFNSIEAVKQKTTKPDVEIKMTDEEFKLKCKRALLYQSQKHFLPRHLMSEHFRSEKFWRN